MLERMQKHSSIDGGNANLYNHSGNQYGGFLENWEPKPQGLAIPLLGIHPKNAQPDYKDICSIMFIAALFVIAVTWKQNG